VGRNDGGEGPCWREIPRRWRSSEWQVWCSY